MEIFKILEEYKLSIESSVTWKFEENKNIMDAKSFKIRLKYMTLEPFIYLNCSLDIK